MHKIGENIVYGSNGVMTIVDIREETIGDISREYYVLKSPDANKDSLTFVPVDNEKLVSSMRPLLSKEEVLDMIRSIDGVPEAEWIGDNRVRSEKFKSIIDSGDRQKIIAMIKAIHETGRRRTEEGKKNYLSDETAMHKAEHVLYSEFALVLGISKEDVPLFISEELERCK